MTIGVVASQAFSPNKLSGLQLWLDASDASTVTESSGLISEWSDKSSNNNNATQVVGADQPTYRLNDINGLNSIDFTAVTTPYFTLSSELELLSLTIIAVFVNTMTGAEGQILAHSTVNNQALRFDPDIGSFGRFSCNDGSSLLSFNFTSSIVDTTTILKAQYEVGDDKSLLVNGAVVAANSYDGDMDIDQVGRLLSNVANMGGKLGELIVYDKILTPTESSSVDNYLANKWGVNLSFPIDFSEDFSSDFS